MDCSFHFNVLSGWCGGSRITTHPIKQYQQRHILQPTSNICGVLSKLVRTWIFIHVLRTKRVNISISTRAAIQLYQMRIIDTTYILILFSFYSYYQIILTQSRPAIGSQSLLDARSCLVRGWNLISFPFGFSCTRFSCDHTNVPMMDYSHTLQEHCSVQTPL